MGYHYQDKTAIRTSYHYSGNSCTGSAAFSHLDYTEMAPAPPGWTAHTIGVFQYKDYFCTYRVSE